MKRHYLKGRTRMLTQLLIQHNDKCVYCGVELALKTYGDRSLRVACIDHMLPRSRGGSDLITNLTCCCRRCNTQKSDRTPEEYEQWKRSNIFGGLTEIEARDKYQREKTTDVIMPLVA